MDWRSKALLQVAFSNLPYGEHLNYGCQRYITKSLPNSDATFAEIVESAREHVGVLERHLGQPLSDATFYEFGAGVTLTIPLAFYALGVRRQILVDIRPLARPDQVNETIDKFRRLGGQLKLIRCPGKFAAGGDFAWHQLKEYYGINYKAPCDARATGLGPDSINFVTSTNTLEHIPPQDIKAILRECHRILHPEGLMSFRIDYHDHYADFDPSISPYNFLRYSESRWRFFSPALHYQNRLRHKDYVALAQEEGFEVVDEKRLDGTQGDLETIARMSLNQRFRAYRLEELAVRNALIVLRKRVSC